MNSFTSRDLPPGRTEDGDEVADPLVADLGERVVEQPARPLAADHR